MHNMDDHHFLVDVDVPHLVEEEAHQSIAHMHMVFAVALHLLLQHNIQGVVVSLVLRTQGQDMAAAAAAAAAGRKH